jgi:Zn-dependent protease/CBS domain-containing protein
MGILAGMRREVLLGRVSGVPVRADLRWFVVIGVMTVLIAASVVQLGQGISILVGAVLGLAATLVFFLSIFLHEYAHAVVARMERLEVVEIVLHPFGGLTRFRHEPETPRAEFRIAIAGPVASFVLAIVFVGFATIGTMMDANVFVVLCGSLAILNFLIAVFNMLPGYPLDGGRVLRAYLWRSGRDLNEATILTGRCGQAIAAVLIVLGLIIAIFRQEFFTGFWAVLAGLFLYDSAKGIIKEVQAMEHVAVDDVMMLPLPITPDVTIQHFIDNILPMNRQAVFPVAVDRKLHGMFVLDELKPIERDKWRTVSIRDVMHPVEVDHFVETGTSLPEAKEISRTNGVGAVAVVDKAGNLVGFVHGLSVRIKR